MYANYYWHKNLPHSQSRPESGNARPGAQPLWAVVLNYVFGIPTNQLYQQFCQNGLSLRVLFPLYNYDTKQLDRKRVGHPLIEYDTYKRITLSAI